MSANGSPEELLRHARREAREARAVIAMNVETIKVQRAKILEERLRRYRLASLLEAVLADVSAADLPFPPASAVAARDLLKEAQAWTPPFLPPTGGGLDSPKTQPTSGPR